VFCVAELLSDAKSRSVAVTLIEFVIVPAPVGVTTTATDEPEADSNEPMSQVTVP